MPKQHEKKSFYGVRAGRSPGVYTDWENCSAQVHGYPGAVFKGFQTRAEAEAFALVPALQTSVAGSSSPYFPDETFLRGEEGWPTPGPSVTSKQIQQKEQEVRMEYIGNDLVAFATEKDLFLYLGLKPADKRFML